MAGIPNRRFSRKKYVQFVKSENELKIRIVATRTNLQNPKQIIGTSNQPIRTKLYPKKVSLVQAIRWIWQRKPKK
jgi:hypothetical protein